MDNEILNNIKKAVKNSYQCCIKHEGIDVNAIYGYPIKCSNQFVLLEDVTCIAFSSRVLPN